MKKLFITFLGTIFAFYLGIVLFALFDEFLVFVGLEFSEGFYYDLVIPPAVGLALSVSFILFIKKRWNLRRVWIVWILGVFAAIAIGYLLISSIPIRR